MNKLPGPELGSARRKVSFAWLLTCLTSSLQCKFSDENKLPNGLITCKSFYAIQNRTSIG